jgi:hypothetical protein
VEVDKQGRHVFVVTWGRPGRRDWRAVLVLAYDPDEACVTARAAYPDLLPPEAAVPASPATARAVLSGRPEPTAANLPILR